MGEKEKTIEQNIMRGWGYFNSRDFESFVKGLPDSYVWYSPAFPAPIHGPEGTKKGLQGFFTVFPDVHFTVDEIWVVDNTGGKGFTGGVRFTGTGTRTNGFMGLPPTDKPFTFSGGAVNDFNLQGQRIATWVFFDRYSILQQLGALPPLLGPNAPGAGGSPSVPASMPTLFEEAASSDEEVLVRYGVGDFKILDNPQYIILRMDLFKPNGERGGHYEGIQETVALPDPQQLLSNPPTPALPIVDPGGIPKVPIGANYKATWWLNPKDSITAIGQSIQRLVPLKDGSMMYTNSAMGLITGGTGEYQGASGVKSATGSVHIPKGGQLTPGMTARGMTLDIFRVIKAKSVAQLPPGSVTTGAAASAGPLPPGMPPLPPTFPKGVNPETYKTGEVTHLLKDAAYLSIFSMPDSARPNKPILSPRGEIIAVEVNEDLHRFDITVEQPNSKSGLRAINRIGQRVARVHIRWTPIPDDFEAAPGREPPPTPLDPTRSQRFAMLDGDFKFDDAKHSGFRGFGTGRTFPIAIAGKPQLRIGAVVNILEGYGRLSGFNGTVVVNGYIDPPNALALSLMARIPDPSGKLHSRRISSTFRELPNPDPNTVFLAFLGETNPGEPTTLNIGPGGQMLGSNVHELLRLVEFDLDVKGGGGIRTSTATGPIVGKLDGTLVFNPLGPPTAAPVPFQTQNGIFNFFDRNGESIGTLKANIVEGRAFATQLAGAPMPVFRFGGFGPLIEGTGQFRDAVGMMSLNAVVSVFPRTLSNLYLLRISDPNGKFRARANKVWGNSGKCSSC